jgi:hypothetical protein
MTDVQRQSSRKKVSTPRQRKGAIEKAKRPTSHQSTRQRRQMMVQVHLPLTASEIPELVNVNAKAYQLLNLSPFYVVRMAYYVLDFLRHTRLIQQEEYHTLIEDYRLAEKTITYCNAFYPYNQYKQDEKEWITIAQLSEKQGCSSLTLLVALVTREYSVANKWSKLLQREPSQVAWSEWKQALLNLKTVVSQMNQFQASEYFKHLIDFIDAVNRLHDYYNLPISMVTALSSMLCKYLIFSKHLSRFLGESEVKHAQLSERIVSNVADQQAIIAHDKKEKFSLQIKALMRYQEEINSLKQTASPWEIRLVQLTQMWIEVCNNPELHVEILGQIETHLTEKPANSMLCHNILIGAREWKRPAVINNTWRFPEKQSSDSNALRSLH